MDSYKALEYFEKIIAIFAFCLAIYAYISNRKQLYSGIINRCMKTYWHINFFGYLNKIDHTKLADTSSTESKELNEKLFQFLDLVNEELFYFQNRYLPKDLSRQWWLGIIMNLPIMASDGYVINSNSVVYKSLSSNGITDTKVIELITTSYKYFNNVTKYLVCEEMTKDDYNTKLLTFISGNQKFSNSILSNLPKDGFIFIKYTNI